MAGYQRRSLYDQEIEALLNEVANDCKNGTLDLEDTREIDRGEQYAGRKAYTLLDGSVILDKAEKRRQLVYHYVFELRWSYRKTALELGISPRTVTKDVEYLRMEIRETGKMSKEDRLTETIERNVQRYEMLLNIYTKADRLNKTATQIQAVEAMRREDEFLVDLLGLKQMSAEGQSLISAIRNTIGAREATKGTWGNSLKLAR